MNLRPVGSHMDYSHPTEPSCEAALGARRHPVCIHIDTTIHQPCWETSRTGTGELRLPSAAWALGENEQLPILRRQLLHKALPCWGAPTPGAEGTGQRVARPAGRALGTRGSPSVRGERQLPSLTPETPQRQRGGPGVITTIIHAPGKRLLKTSAAPFASSVKLLPVRRYEPLHKSAVYSSIIVPVKYHSW